jgi:hypothetical protein
LVFDCITFDYRSCQSMGIDEIELRGIF